MYLQQSLFSSVAVVTGEVYSWGSGFYGRLGHGNLRDRFSPLMIGAPLRGQAVTYIACHEFHSAAVCGGYRTFACACLVFLGMLSQRTLCVAEVDIEQVMC